MQNLIDGSYRARLDVVAPLMKSGGFSMLRLAKVAEVDRKTIRRLLRGERLRLATFAQVAEALGTTAEAIIDDTDGPVTSEDGSSSPVQKRVTIRVSAEAGFNPSDPKAGPTDGTTSGDRKTGLWRASFDLEMTYSLFHEQEQLPELLAKLGEKMQQVGMIFIESTGPSNSVRIVFWATDAGDMDRLFTAFSEGRLADLQIKNLRRLDPPSELEDIDDDETHSNEQAESPPAEKPEPASQRVPSPTESKPPPLESGWFTPTVAAAAAAGATIGSAVPVVGTAIGAAIGVFVGAMFAKQFVHDKQDPTPEKPPENHPRE